METKKNISFKLREKHSSPLQNEIWTIEDITRVIQKLKMDSVLTEAQAISLIKLLGGTDSSLLIVSKIKFSEIQFSQFLSSACNVESDSPVKIALALLCGVPSTSSQFLHSCLKSIRRILQNVIPEDSKSRHLNAKNFMVKKYIVDFLPAMILFKSIGFRLENDPETHNFVISEIDAQNIKQNDVISLIDESISNLSSTSKISVRCKAGCGFYGDDGKNGYCEKCSEKRANEDKKSNTKRTFCRNNCGFFGSEESEGLCSCCFKEKSKIALEKEKMSKKSKENSQDEKEETVETKQKDKTRCWKCSKKIRLAPISCDCKYYFCANHRSTLDHECDFDHKKKFETKLIKENPLVSSKKIDKL